MADPCANAFDADTFIGTFNSDGDQSGGEIQASMGIGDLGASTTLLKRKFRFLFGITTCKGTNTVSPSFVKSAGRPDITIQDTELNFLNQTMWIPGKAKWETITVTYWDAAGAQSANLFSWLASVYDFTNDCRFMASQIQDYAGVATLVMLDGCGNPIESWVMQDAWPSAIKFGDLAYDSSDVAEVELTLRYSQVTYNSFCSGDINPCACSSC